MTKTLPPMNNKIVYKKIILPSILLILIAILEPSKTITIQAQEEKRLKQQDDSSTNQNKEYKTKGINYDQFLNLLYTEASEEYNGLESTEQLNALWMHQTEFDWRRAELRESSSSEEINKKSPFLICHNDPHLSGKERKSQLLKQGLSSQNMLLLQNSKKSTCFQSYVKASWFEKAFEALDIVIQPVSYSMKLLSGSIELVDELLMTKGKEGERGKIGSDIMVDVLLCPGVDAGNMTAETEDVLDKVTNATQKTTDEFKDVMDKIDTILYNATGALTNATNEGVDQMTDSTLEEDIIQDTVADDKDFDKVMDKLDTILYNATGALTNATNEGVDQMTDSTLVQDIIQDTVGDTIDTVQDTVGDAMDNPQDKVQDMVQDALDDITKTEDKEGDNPHVRRREEGRNKNRKTKKRKKRKLSSEEQDRIRENLLTQVRSSLNDELPWMTSTITTPRVKFWKTILWGNDDDMCNKLYDKVDFKFTSAIIEETNSNLHLMTIDFSKLIVQVKHLVSNHTSPPSSNTTTKEYKTTLVKTCQKCILKLVLALALLPETCSIQTRPKIEAQNQNAQWLAQSGIEEEYPWYDLGLDGTGEVVAVSDTGIDMNHCYFENGLDGAGFVYGRPYTLDINQRKVVQYDDYVDKTDYEYGHGTHTAGSVAGCKSDKTGISKGIAPGAKLAFIDIGTPHGGLNTPDTERLLDTGRPYANIHSASWGGNYAGYGLMSYFFDAYTYENDELLVFVAAGNSGRGDASQTVGEPATAKNLIAVGAGHSYGSGLSDSMLGPAYVADFSSRGPTLDGRTKPEILAPGQWISSAGALPNQKGACDPSDGIPPAPGSKKEGLVSFQGTSMATPIAAGTAAIIRQYLREGFYPTGERNSNNAITNPSSALLKALLLNGAQNMKGVDNTNGKITNVYPYDNTQNFGRISLVDSLFLKDKSNVQVKLWDRELVEDGETKLYNVVIDMSNGCTANTFTATLVWTDLPGLSGCANCLINDIDLFVVKNRDESITYFPNGLNTKDSKNNAERVRIEGEPNVKDGDVFTISIQGDSVVSDVQAFALVATGCFPGSTDNKSPGFNVFGEDSSVEGKGINFKLIGICISAAVLLAGCCAFAFMAHKKRPRTGVIPHNGSPRMRSNRHLPPPRDSRHDIY